MTEAKHEIRHTDQDFEGYDVTLDNHRQRRDLVVSADVGRGELVRRCIDGNGLVVDGEVTVRGDVRITARGPEDRPVPREDPPPLRDGDDVKVRLPERVEEPSQAEKRPPDVGKAPEAK